MSNRVRRSVFFAVVLSLCVSIASAQIETARITGTVSDSSGAVIPGAEITFSHLATGQESIMQAAADGRFVSVPLRIGEYRLSVSSPGFKRFEQSGIVLQVQETAEINILLEVGAVTETIDVTSDAPLLETAQATQGQVIDNQRIVDMPLNGRDYIELALLSAGAQRPIGGRFGGFSSGGQRTTQNNYTLDGLDNNGLQIAAQGRRAEVVKPSIDAVQEFKISTNAYSDESGRALGGTVNVTIKSGTNDFHDTAFWFVRNEKLDARNFFDGANKPPFKRNQYGASAGGPIIKNKTFIFGDFEGTLIRESRTFNETIPTQAQLSGDFSGVSQQIYDPDSLDDATGLRAPFSGNIIPSSQLDPVAVAASKFYPAPNQSGLTQNWRTNAPDKEDIRRWDLRVDHILSASDNIFGRYSQNFNDVPGSLRFPSGQDGDGTDFKHYGDNFAFAWNHIFSPTTLMNVKAGWNRIYTERRAVADQNLNQVTGFTGVNQSLLGSAVYNISGMRNIGTSNYTPNLIDSQSRQLTIDLTKTVGSHSFKFGYNLQFLQSYLTNPQQELGQPRFNGNFSRQTKSIAGQDRGGRPAADFMLGIPYRTDVSTSVYMNLRSVWHHFYAQDEWRVTPKLTVTAGLRYELSLPWTEKDDQISNFDIDTNPAAPNFVMAQSGSWADRATTSVDYTNIAPRFGFAYKLRTDTVLRGGYGIFYANYEGTGGGQYLETNPPFHIKTQLTTDSIHPSIRLKTGVPDGIFEPENAVGLSFSSFERQGPGPISQQWNMNVQQSLGENLVWEFGYYGTKGNHLVNRIDGNWATPGPGNVNSNRRYNTAIWPGTDTVVGPLAAMNRHEYNGNSLYHSFQTRIERRFANGFTLLGSYMFAKTIGDSAGFAGSGNSPAAGIQNPTNRKPERGLDGQHRKHTFTTSFIFDLPFGSGRRWATEWSGVKQVILGGWTTASIFQITSGRPFGLSVRGNPANTGQLNRPNVVASEGNPNLSGNERTLDRWFNTDAFVANDEYTFGNAGRNILIGDSLFNWDFALYKQFVFTERLRMQFRFEAFNLPNHATFGFPNAEVGNNNFGRISGAGRPRNLQFGLKLLW